MKSENYNDLQCCTMPCRNLQHWFFQIYNSKEYTKHLSQWIRIDETIKQNIVIMSHSIVYQCNVVVYNDSWIRNNAINFLVCMQKLMKLSNS